MSSLEKKPERKPVPVAERRADMAAGSAWEGPLPPPEALQKFDRVIAGGAERIFAMAEREQQHRIAFEQSALEANARAAQAEIDAARRGHYMGLAVTCLALVCAVVSVAIGADWRVSIAFVGIPIMSAVRTLIAGDPGRPEKNGWPETGPQQ